MNKTTTKRPTSGYYNKPINEVHALLIQEGYELSHQSNTYDDDTPIKHSLRYYKAAEHKIIIIGISLINIQHAWVNPLKDELLVYDVAILNDDNFIVIKDNTNNTYSVLMNTAELELYLYENQSQYGFTDDFYKSLAFLHKKDKTELIFWKLTKYNTALVTTDNIVELILDYFNSLLIRRKGQYWLDGENWFIATDTIIYDKSLGLDDDYYAYTEFSNKSFCFGSIKPALTNVEPTTLKEVENV